MISRTTRQFWIQLKALPPDVQSLAAKAYQLWLADPWHPGLQFKQVDNAEPIYSVRIGLGYRALGVRSGSTVTWFWIGKHEMYDRKLREEEAFTAYG
jgi:hypothetical protein